MKRILGHGLKFGALAALAFVLTPACAENDMSIYIRHVQAPPQNRQNGQCIYLPDATVAFMSSGTLDAAVRDNYQAFMLVGSQLIPRADDDNTRAESNRTHLNGAVVKVTDPNGGLISEFTATTSGMVDVNTNNASTFGLASVTLLDAPTVARIGGGLALGQTRLVLAVVKVFGTTLGGVDVESGEFQFPIRVCRGCLVSFASGDDPATDGIDCKLPLADSGGGGQTVLPCQAGQDEGTPCQLCLDKAECQGR